MKQRKKGVVDIHGREYKTVVLRVNEFRSECPARDGWAINTFIVEVNEKWAMVGCKIITPDEKIVGSGHGVEFWGSTNINKTSALENAETSAIGRALSSIGLGGEEYASADEVLSAIRTQGEMDEQVLTVEEPAPTMVPDNVLEVVKANIKTLNDKLGEDKHKEWHKRVLKNFYSVDSLQDMTDEQLADFADKQQQRIGLEKD